MTEDTRAAGAATTPPKTLGENIATLGAAMFVVSIILAFAGVSGATFHNMMQLGGIVLGIVGVIMWKVLKK